MTMPGCAAIGCNNRSEKGYTMKCFPRNPVLRQIWKERVGRADWEPSNNSFLCHAHFDPNQWIVTHCGRLKLRKGAIPSIFEVVSTRKSPSKRRRMCSNGKNGAGTLGIEILNDDQESYVYLESSESTNNLDGDSIVILDSENSTVIRNTNGKDENVKNLYQIITSDNLVNPDSGNVIVISDENDTEVGPFISNSNNFIIINRENGETNNHMRSMEVSHNSVSMNPRVKVEIKSEVADDQSINDDIYDEVESNMERIYEGINTDEDSNNPISSLSIKDGNQSSSAMPRKIYGRIVSKKELESQEENSFVNGQQTVVGISDTFSCLDNSDENSKSSSIVTNTLSNGTFLIEDTDDDNPSMKNSGELSNFEAALLRKKKAREKTMKSIEKIISDTGSSSKSRNCSKSEISSTFNINNPDGNKNFNGDECSATFIEWENILSKNIKIEKVSQTDSEEVTSDTVKYSKRFNLKQEVGEVIVLDPDDDSSGYPDQTQQYQCYDLHESQHNNHLTFFDNQEDLKSVSRRGLKRIRNIQADIEIGPNSNSHLNSKVKQQQEIIAKLNARLSVYRDMERKLNEISDELKLRNKEITILSAKLNRKDSTQERNDRHVAAMQALIKDLTNKVKNVEDINRRLSRTVTVENQNKKNLEYQLRSKDKLIKELNWKMEKASKLLERAEKNATTYKRKMNNMRALIRRKHLDIMDEKQTPFDVLFQQYVKHDFSDDSLRSALEIQKVCGSKGYEKLLEYNFPLPSQRTLRRRFQRESIHENESHEASGSAFANNSEEKKPIFSDWNSELCRVNEADLDDSIVTITGTVQDIFNESDNIDPFNEDEVMSENELRENLCKFLNVDL